MLGNLDTSSRGITFVPGVLVFVDGIAVDFFRVGNVGICGDSFDLLFIKALS